MIDWIVLSVVLAIFAAVMLGLWHEATRPINEIDEWCSAVDDDLDAQRWASVESRRIA